MRREEPVDTALDVAYEPSNPDPKSRSRAHRVGRQAAELRDNALIDAEM
jgi:hypothetical protein